VKYSRFEWLIIGVGGITMAASLLLTSRSALIPQEVVGQLLLFAVLVGAVRWGRNGGFVAALAAVLVYILMRVPLITNVGMTRDVLSMILVRLVSFGAVGILGGELCGRMKYVFAGLEGRRALDEVTRLYNESFVVELLQQNLALQERYKTPLAVVLLTIAPALMHDLRPAKQRSLMRAVGNLIRNDVRLVDEVGRLSDGRFVLILPNTDKGGAHVAANRVRRHVCDLLGAKDGAVSDRVLAAPDDTGELALLVASLRLEDGRVQASSA